MRPLPSGWRLVGFAFAFAVIVGIGGLVAWMGNQLVAAALGAAIALALLVRAVVLLTHLKANRPSQRSESDDQPRWES